MSVALLVGRNTFKSFEYKLTNSEVDKAIHEILNNINCKPFDVIDYLNINSDFAPKYRKLFLDTFSNYYWKRQSVARNYQMYN